MTALRILGWWVGASLLLAGLRGDIESPAGAEPTCPACADLARQLAAAKDHVRLLERASKVVDLLVQRRGGAA